ncbi:MAG: patatin-like phospholipase family protein [Chitinophagales bacterium]
MEQPESKIRLPSELPVYEVDTAAVIQQELECYLQARRALHQLPPASADNLVGMSISGGGVRSATLGLGMLQAFLRQNRLKTVDYLSTVSGGGFIGSCLTSLLSAESTWVDKQQTLPNDNPRFTVAENGLEPDNALFLSKEEDDPLPTAENGKLNALHQLRHLRRHGAYLTPRMGLFGWDVRRAIGALSGGLVVNSTLYVLLLSAVVLLHHLLLGWLSRDQFLDAIQAFAGIAGDHRLLFLRGDYWQAAWELIQPSSRLVFFFVGLGMVAGLLFLKWLRTFPLVLAARLAEERKYNGSGAGKLYTRSGGLGLEYQQTRFFRTVLAGVAYFGGPILSYGVVGYGMTTGWMQENEYFIFLLLPFFFNLGMFAVVHFLVTFHFINRGKERVSGRFYRDFFYGLQGSVLIGLLLTTLFPIGITILFSQHVLLSKLLAGAFGIVVLLKISTYSIARWNYFTLFLKGLQGVLLNWSVILFVSLSFALLSGWLFQLECWMTGRVALWRFEAALILLLITLFLLLVIGFFANNNDISLHYFFRDRISEAYLRTDAKVVPSAGVASKDSIEVNFRNHDNLLLQAIGDGNNRGPYPILVGALNLQGAPDAGRRAQRSDHFIFSKFYVGSKTTGYFRTDRYNGGQTRLSTAVTISAAAVSGGMGLFGFAASHFYMTLFNLRTGYWVYNPPFLRKKRRLQERLAALRQWAVREKKGLSSYWVLKVKSLQLALQLSWSRSTFWLGYLLAEFLGRLSAEKKLVYVSDGGHTGDNLGLIPLIQRRCKLIYLADFEEDEHYSFSSFNQAILKAEVDYQTKIQIDLRPLVPDKGNPPGLGTSMASAVKGVIEYPNGQKGILIYMKSAVSWKAGIPSNAIRSFEGAPPVLSYQYLRSNPLFPHQPTADQYFSEVQFEAYRMLGESIGEQALQVNLEEETST